MLRTRADMREAGRLQQPAHRCLIEIDRIARHNEAPEIDAAPAHNAIGLWIGASLNQRCDLGLLPGRQFRLGARRLGIDQAVGSARIERMHPIAQRLAIHAADQSRRLAAHAVPHARQGKQAAGAVGVPASCR